MEFSELVKKRCSTRKYSSKRVPREILEKCTEAARLSPSACNSQPWSFIIIDDEKLKNEVSEKAFGNIYSMNMFTKEAPVIVAVVTLQSKFTAKAGGFFRGTNFNLIDVGIAIEHFVLQAEEEGLGTCILGWFNEKQVKKILKLPRSARLDILISAGYSENQQKTEKKRKPLEEIRKYNMQAG